MRESYVVLIPTPPAAPTRPACATASSPPSRTSSTTTRCCLAGVKLTADDAFGRASFVLSARVLDPSFQGQTKERSTAATPSKLVSRMVRDPFELWLNEHVDYGKKLAELAIKPPRPAPARPEGREAQVFRRRRAAGQTVRLRVGGHRRERTLPVEGDSAGGSAKMACDKDNTQAILPLRGKVQNAWEVDRERLFANAEIHDIAVAPKIDPHSGRQRTSPAALRQVIIMSDADVDGPTSRPCCSPCSSATSPSSSRSGHIYVAQPPLYRLDVPPIRQAPAARACTR